MLPIIRRELSVRRTSLIFYFALLAGMVVLYTSIFPTIQAQSANFAQLIKSLGGVYKAMGIGGTITFNTLENYMSTELFGVTWPILAVVFTTGFAGSAIAGEIEKGTLGMVLALPIKRMRIYLAKYAAGLASFIGIVIVSCFTIMPVAAAEDIHFQAANFVTVAILCLMFGWAIFSLALMVSAMCSDKGRVYGIIGGLMAVMYVANAVAGIKQELSWIKYGSFFHYFAPTQALGSNHISPWSYLVFSAVAIVATVIGAVWFSRRDISI
jgi:ABC-2 type transport system permease protein